MMKSNHFYFYLCFFEQWDAICEIGEPVIVIMVIHLLMGEDKQTTQACHHFFYARIPECAAGNLLSREASVFFEWPKINGLKNPVITSFLGPPCKFGV